jgi:signal transduction histidine kinase
MIFNVKPRGIGKISYPFRVLAYLFGNSILCFHLFEAEGFNFLSVTFITFTFLWPHLAYLFYLKKDCDSKLESYFMIWDAFYLGIFINILDYAFFPSFAFVSMTIASHIALNGFSRLFLLGITSLSGIFISALSIGINFQPESSHIENIISAVYLLIYCNTFAYAAFRRSVLLKESRTQSKLQNEELIAKTQQLEKINHENTMLVGIVAHDLRTPLNQILGYINIIKLLHTDLEKDLKHTIDTIESTAFRLRDMISKILNISSLETGEVTFNKQVLDLKEIIENILIHFNDQAVAKNIQLNLNIHSGRFESLVDKAYFTQIMENLLSNAIKFSPPHKKIHIILKEENNQIIIQVKDEGPGFTEEDKQRLFVKYQKLSAKPTANETSTGLGLSIIKKFTEAMNGSIYVESEEGNGATFIVKFAQHKNEEATV